MKKDLDITCWKLISNPFTSGRKILDCCQRTKEIVSMSYLSENLKPFKLGMFFYTRYNGGDFLYPHTDSPNGKVALVLHLTRDWKPWYGGNLCLLGEKWGSVRETLVPQYNSLMLMNIVDKKNPHFVEYIPEFVKKPRYAMVCWFE